jgi:hypothetical protein
MIFRDIRFKFVYHLDGLVVYSEDFSQHLRHIDEVFIRLRDSVLTVNPAKFVFAGQEICFLGHRVSPVGASIDPGRTRYKRVPPAKRRPIHKYD